MSDLLLQATPELLDGWCGPGFSKTHGRIVVMGWQRPPGGAQGDDGAFAIQVVQTGGALWVQPEGVFFDLSRDECLARVLHVLGLRYRAYDLALAPALLAVARQVLHGEGE